MQGLWAKITIQNQAFKAKYTALNAISGYTQCKEHVVAPSSLLYMAGLISNLGSLPRKTVKTQKNRLSVLWWIVYWFHPPITVKVCSTSQMNKVA